MRYLCMVLISAPSPHHPRRLVRSLQTRQASIVDVGPGTKWHSPIKPQDVRSLLASQPDIAEAYQQRGWRAAMLLLYRDYIAEAGLDTQELRGKDLSCTCKLTQLCHADVLLELANRPGPYVDARMHQTKEGPRKFFAGLVNQRFLHQASTSSFALSFA